MASRTPTGSGGLAEVIPLTSSGFTRADQALRPKRDQGHLATVVPVGHGGRGSQSQDGRHPPLPPWWSEPIRAWLNWLRSDGRPAESIAVRRTQVTRLAHERAHRSPWELTTQDLAEWLAEHPAWSISYRRAVRSGIRSFYAWARATGRTEVDPAQLLPRTRPQLDKPRPVPDQVVEHALDMADARVRLMLELGRGCGLRRAEIAAVSTEDLQAIDGVPFLRVHGKGRRERMVPLTFALAADILAAGPGDVFPSPARPGRPLTAAHVGKLIRRALAGTWTAHTLRHGFATAAFQVDRDLIAVRDLLGHSSVATTQMYVLAPDDAVMRAAAGAQLRRIRVVA